MEFMIDRSGCIGCGMCVSTCPEVFQMADDGLAEVVHQPGPQEQDAAMAAAEGCPVSVIHTEG